MEPTKHGFSMAQWDFYTTQSIPLVNVATSKMPDDLVNILTNVTKHCILNVEQFDINSFRFKGLLTILD